MPRTGIGRGVGTAAGSYVPLAEDDPLSDLRRAPREKSRHRREHTARRLFSRVRSLCSSITPTAEGE